MNKLCCNPILELFEFPIEDKNFEILIQNYPINRENLCKLKLKIICEFLDIIHKLECGILPDLELLLEEISYIYIHE